MLDKSSISNLHSRQNLCCVYRRDLCGTKIQYRQFLQTHGRARELNRRHGFLREAAVAENNIAICLTQQGHYREAVTLLDSTLVTCVEENYRDVEHAVLNQLGLIRRQQERHLSGELDPHDGGGGGGRPARTSCSAG